MVLDFHNPRVSGYVLTALDDVAWECHGGLLDLWRNPKPAYYALQRLNQHTCLILRTRHPSVDRGANIDPVAERMLYNLLQFARQSSSRGS